MKFSSIYIAFLAVAYGFNLTDIYSAGSYPAPVSNPLSSVESLLATAEQVQTSLNAQLNSAIADKHLSPEFLTSYIVGVDSEINQVVSAVQSAVSSYSPSVGKAIIGSIIGPYYEEVTKGAQTLVDNTKSSPGTVDVRTTAGLIVNYQRLADLANYAEVDTSKLEQLSQECNALASYSVEKRATNSDMSGVHGAVANFKETIDTLYDEVTKDKGHAAEAAVTALITGLDGQVDNLAATIFNVANTVTYGLTSPIGDFLLGPIFQGLTNGVQVLISNVVGGSIDMVADGTAELFSGTMSKLISLGKKVNVAASNVAMLEDAHKQWTSLNATLNKKGHSSSNSTATA